jgi:hypothetical protein
MILNFIGITLVTILSLIGLTTIYSLIKIYGEVKRDVKYARVRIEWESDCVTYKAVSYLDDKTLSLVLSLLATATMREETDGGAKRLVQDKVKAVTVVHSNWPRPSAGSTEGE